MGVSDALVGVVDARLKVGVGLLTAGGGVAGGWGVRWAGAEGAWRRVTLGSGRLTFGLWVRGGRGLSLSFFSVFLMVLSHSNGSSLPSSLFIKQVLGAIRMYRDSFTFLSCKSLKSYLPLLSSIRWVGWVGGRGEELQSNRCGCRTFLALYPRSQSPTRELLTCTDYPQALCNCPITEHVYVVGLWYNMIYTQLRHSW